jgi:hypothetical protein
VWPEHESRVEHWVPDNLHADHEFHHQLCSVRFRLRNEQVPGSALQYRHFQADRGLLRFLLLSHFCQQTPQSLFQLLILHK